MNFGFLLLFHSYESIFRSRATRARLMKAGRAGGEGVTFPLCGLKARVRADISVCKQGLVQGKGSLDSGCMQEARRGTQFHSWRDLRYIRVRSARVH